MPLYKYEIIGQDHKCLVSLTMLMVLTTPFTIKTLLDSNLNLYTEIIEL